MIGVPRLTTSFLRLVGCAIVFLLTLGCGSADPTGQVAGKVTYKGAPVTEGAVLISNSSTGVSAQAQIAADGSYTITTQKGGLPPGDYKVTVMPPEIPGPIGDGNSEPGMIVKPVDNIPQKYRIPTSTPLTVAIKEGGNEFNISMEE